MKHYNFVMTLLKKVGFLINLEKLDLALSCSIHSFDLIWDISLLSVSRTDEEVEKLLSSAQNSNSQHSNFTSFAVPQTMMVGR